MNIHTAIHLLTVLLYQTEKPKNREDLQDYRSCKTMCRTDSRKFGQLISANMGIFQISGQNSTEDYSWGGTFNSSIKEKTAAITMRLSYRVNQYLQVYYRLPRLIHVSLLKILAMNRLDYRYSLNNNFGKVNCLTGNKAILSPKTFYYIFLEKI